ncbi:MAG: hypothetical protein IJ266_05650, partial [Elusimicrobiaceae bacterium]|nr:hypothetical protein [Elusimicrobiaceae bacterium]
MKKVAILLMAALLAMPALAAKNTKKTTAKKAKAEFVVVESGEYAAGKEDAGLTAGLANFLEVEPAVTKLTQLQAMQDPALANLDYSFLPVYLIKKTDAVRKKMEPHIQRGYVQETADYIVLTHQTRTGVYTHGEAKPGVMEIFVMSQCPYGVMAENAVIEAKKNGEFPQDKAVKIRYI